VSLLPKRGRPITLGAPWGELARAVGGVDVLARKIGVAPRTIRNWALGTNRCRGPALAAVRRLLAKHKISHDFDAKEID
jgi:hypothetical protein